MAIALNYDDVYLVPNKCIVDTRSAVDTSIQLGKYSFGLPVVPANMVSTINAEWAKLLDKNNFFYVMHRFNNATADFVRSAQEMRIVSISTGISDESFNEIKSLQHQKVDYVTIDVAHGHCDRVAYQIDNIKKHLPGTFIIAGNVATASAVEFLENAGADAIKAGIGGGVICTTKNQTGFHVPMFTCVKECASAIKNAVLIADGGVKQYGDIAKALVAGADMVMAGGIFAGCSDSPAAVVHGKKLYFGSTSFTAKQKNDHVEGRTISVDVEGDLQLKLHEITQALQSAVSYSGGVSTKDLNTSIKFATSK